MLNQAIKRARVGLSAAALVAVVAIPMVANAQVSSGWIEGKVVDASNNKPLGDVVITATSPALQGEQTVVSDATGDFEIPTLPPGTYLLHLEKEGYKPLNQPDVAVRLDKKVRVNLPLVPENVKAEEIVIVGKAPTVDVGSTQSGSTITEDFINNIPVAADNVRSFESLQATAPGTAGDDYGISVAGTTSPENSYVIDGIEVNSPAYGTLGSAMSVDFIKEVDVITGGYMAEYGHAQGGVANVVTKSGGNEFHGSVGLYVTPGFLTAPAKNVVSQGTAISVTPIQNLNANLVIEVGGPIIKDKLWFYAGLAPTITQVEIDRFVNVTTYQKGCPVDVNGQPVASSADPAFSSYSADQTNCSATVRGVATDPTGSPLIASTTPVTDSKRKYYANTFQYQYIAKLTYLLNENQRFSASVWGNPGNSQGGGGGPGPESAFATVANANANDVTLRWDGSFFDKHMLTEAVFGLHHQYSDSRPEDPALENAPAYFYGYQPPGLQHSLVEFEPDSAKWCGANDSSQKFMTCPLASGYVQGYGSLIQTLIENSYQGRVSATNLFKAAGHHEVKYGIDYLAENYNSTTAYPGGVVFQEVQPGVWDDSRRFGYLAGPDQPVFEPNFHNVTKSTELSGFIQDSYRVLDLFTLNVGVRWEDQQLIGGLGQTVVSLPNNIQPRIGAIYDPTQSGRSKIFASYAVYYEQMPIDLLDREFPPSTTIVAYHQCDPKTTPNPNAPGGCADPATVLPLSSGSVNNQWIALGGASTPVDPNLKGESSSEISAGGEYEIIPDGRLGVTYSHRWMNNVIEDGSQDNANTYVLGNAGQGVLSSFPKWSRNYDAGSIYFNKSFSHRWQFEGSYTLSRLAGNYQGLFASQGGIISQLDPNINASGDLKQWFVNSDGVLPGDHTHNFKVFGAYDLPVTTTSDLTLGIAYYGLSGGPTDYAGYDYISYNYYAQPNLFILPRGSGPRLPWTHEFDASFKFNKKIADASTLTASVEIFNLFDFREVTSVNQVYSNSVLAHPIVNGTTADLANLKDASGNPAVKNPTFGQPNSYQAPLSVRLGLKLTF
ncbi:MAG: TonB-dependent receptor [Deltaproteobacteria bacterium]|nr:TonB-dependent receptor [Deltaproteobacteria bacterium]